MRAGHWGLGLECGQGIAGWVWNVGKALGVGLEIVWGK